MIISREFIERVIQASNEKLIYSKELIYKETVNTFMYSLIGSEHMQAIRKLSKQMVESAKLNSHARNAYVHFYRVLTDNIDYGFEEGEKVFYPFSSHTKRIGNIQKIDGSKAYFSDVIVSLQLVSKFEEKPIQLSLF